MKQRYGYKSLGNSLGGLVGALINGDKYEEAGRRDAQKSLAELMLTQARASKADAEAEQLRQRMEGAKTGRQDFLMGQTGLAQPQLQQLQDFSRTGNWGATELEGPPNPGQRSMPSVPNTTPEWNTPGLMNNYNRAMSTLGMSAVAPGKTNAAHLGDAIESLAKTGNIDAMISGQIDPSQAAAAYGAAAGKPVYSQGTQGVLNQYSGDRADTPKLGAEVAALQALTGQRAAAGRAYDAKAEALGRPGGAGGSVSANVQWAEYLQSKLGLTPDQTLAFFQQSKFNPQKAAIDLAKAMMRADAEVASMNVGMPRRSPEEFIAEAQRIVTDMNGQGVGAQPGAAAPVSEDPLGLMQ